MKIQYCSDLHLEFEENNRFLSENAWEISGDVLVLAGDIAPLHDRYFAHPFFSFLSANYQEVFWVPGNHEYYHRDLNDFKQAFHLKIRDNIHLLHNKSIVFEGVSFIFSSLWSHISNLNFPVIEKGIADFTAITIKGKRLRASDYNELHNQSLIFLKEAIASTKSPKIVVTHHLPSVLCNSPEHAESPLNEAYCTDLTHYVSESNAEFWIYGHSHHNRTPLILGKTMLLTNQLGIVLANEHLSFRKSAYFSV